MQKNVFVISIGNSNSRISYIDETGTPVVVLNRDGMNETPSVVYWEDEDTPLVGQAAKENAVVDFESACFLINASLHDEKYVFQIGERKFLWEDIAALIMKDMVTDTEDYLGVAIKDVILTCPSYYGMIERTALLSAGRKAGLHVVNVINEPAAVALYYQHLSDHQLSDKKEKNVLVYDLGGTSLDVSVLRVTPKSAKIVSIYGDHTLGGMCWDHAILSYAEDEFQMQYGTDSFSPEERQELMLQAEKVKMILTFKEEAKMRIVSGGARGSITITRQVFEELTELYVRQTLDYVDRLLENANEYGVEKIDEVLLAGGAAKMPQIKQALEMHFPGVPVRMETPDLACAKGGALSVQNVIDYA